MVGDGGRWLEIMNVKPNAGLCAHTCASGCADGGSGRDTSPGFAAHGGRVIKKRSFLCHVGTIVSLPLSNE
jgi:hypothetical protein